MKSLRIELNKKSNALILQIIKQNGLPTEFNGDVVSISDEPRIEKDKIFLRGSNSEADNNVSVVNFSSKKERDEAYDMFLEKISEELFPYRGSSNFENGDLVEYKEDGEWCLGILVDISPNGYYYVINLNHKLEKSLFLSNYFSEIRLPRNKAHKNFDDISWNELPDLKYRETEFRDIAYGEEVEFFGGSNHNGYPVRDGKGTFLGCRLVRNEKGLVIFSNNIKSLKK